MNWEQIAEACGFLSTLSLRRATHPQTSNHPHNTNFYPRSPCGERQDTLTDDVSTGGFLSTLSLRRATVLVWCFCGGAFDFYPRSPCGERPIIQEITVLTIAFLSTLSLRRATGSRRRTYQQGEFLSTLSLRRATAEVGGSNQSIINFYPRSPCGERPRTQSQSLSA